MATLPIERTASLRLWQCGEYVEDGARYPIGPVICQTYLDANGNWTTGFYNALDPSRSFAIDGVNDDAAAGNVDLYRRLAEISAKA